MRLTFPPQNAGATVSTEGSTAGGDVPVVSGSDLRISVAVVRKSRTKPYSDSISASCLTSDSGVAQSDAGVRLFSARVNFGGVRDSLVFIINQPCAGLGRTWDCPRPGLGRGRSPKCGCVTWSREQEKDAYGLEPFAWIPPCAVSESRCSPSSTSGSAGATVARPPRLPVSGSVK